MIHRKAELPSSMVTKSDVATYHFLFSVHSFRHMSNSYSTPMRNVHLRMTFSPAHSKPTVCFVRLLHIWRQVHSSNVRQQIQASHESQVTIRRHEGPIIATLPVVV